MSSVPEGVQANQRPEETLAVPQAARHSVWFRRTHKRARRLGHAGGTRLVRECGQDERFSRRSTWTCDPDKLTIDDNYDLASSASGACGDRALMFPLMTMCFTAKRRERLFRGVHCAGVIVLRHHRDARTSTAEVPISQVAAGLQRGPMYEAPISQELCSDRRRRRQKQRQRWNVVDHNAFPDTTRHGGTATDWPLPDSLRLVLLRCI